MSHENLDFFKKAYETKESTDLVIIFNGVTHHAHSLVLGMKSNYFKSLFLSKQKGRIVTLKLDIPYISQDALEHFLKYCYGWELDMDYVLPMLSFSSHFECDELWKETTTYRLFKLPFSETHALHLFQHVFPKLTLDETTKVRHDTLLMDSVIWFTVHFDKILELKLESLKSISMIWLRYVFGKAPFHVFESEFDRLEKARQLYFKLGESKELFSALFEGIRFNCIDLRGMFHEKYLFLYQCDNDIVLEKLEHPRIFDQSMHRNHSFLTRSPSLVMKMDMRFEAAPSFLLANNAKMNLHYKLEESCHSLELQVSFWPAKNWTYSSYSLSFFLFAFQENLERWSFFYTKDSNERRRDSKISFHSRFTRYSGDSSNMMFRINLLSLNVFTA
jgi:hypothetical protein